MKKIQSESVRELCNVRGDGEGSREYSSVATKGFGENVLISLWSSNTEGNGRGDLSGKFRVSWL